MIISIICSIILIFVMYNCCDRYEYKTTWFIYFLITLIGFLLQNGLSMIIIGLAYSAIVSTIMVYLYYKAFERCNDSFGKFFLWCIVYQLVLIGITIVLTAIIAGITADVASNGILKNAKIASQLMGA